jgi:hypothetical protein
MRLSRTARSLTLTLAATVGSAVPTVTLCGQEPAAAQPRAAVARLVAEPARVNLKVGDSLAFKVTAYDAQGKEIPDAPVRVGGPRMAVYFGDGIVRGIRAGSYR